MFIVITKVPLLTFRDSYVEQWTFHIFQFEIHVMIKNVNLKFSYNNKCGIIKFDGIRTVGSKVTLNVLETYS